MEVLLKHGIDRLRFGMREADVVALYGEPTKKITDEDGNILYLYNEYKWQLTFYEDEEFRLGYIISSNPNLTLFGHKVIGSAANSFAAELKLSGIINWEVEEFDITENFFDEKNWLILQSDFGEVAKVELGAIISDDDEFEWKF